MSSPAITRKTQNFQSHYTELSKKVKDAGLLNRRHGYYWTKITLLLAAFAGVWVGFAFLGDSWWQLALAAAFAVVATQFAFLAHDAAHKQMFDSSKLNEWSALVIANLIGGLSSGWWNAKHTKHHAAPNQKTKDPDISSSVLAFTPEAARQRTRIGRWLASKQGYFFYPLLFLEGLNLHAQSLKMLFSFKSPVKRRWVEISFILARLGAYLGVIFYFLPLGQAFAFLGVQLAVFGFYMGAAFTPNHLGMPLVPKELRVDFLSRQVLMSRNIKGGRLMAFAMGGLNYQIEHHLFPSMPRPNLRKARKLVMKHCAEKNVPYTETTLASAYKTVFHYLNQVGSSRDPFQCPLVREYRIS